MFAVSDLDAGTRADDVMRRLRDAAPEAEILQCRIGGVVGAHTGPGVVAIAVTPDEAPISI
jgi:fatty acid-binding protein DegV